MEQSVQVLSECPMGRSKTHNQVKEKWKIFHKIHLCIPFSSLDIWPLIHSCPGPGPRVNMSVQQWDGTRAQERRRLLPDKTLSWSPGVYCKYRSRQSSNISVWLQPAKVASLAPFTTTICPHGFPFPERDMFLFSQLCSLCKLPDTFHVLLYSELEALVADGTRGGHRGDLPTVLLHTALPEQSLCGPGTR